VSLPSSPTDASLPPEPLPETPAAQPEAPARWKTVAREVAETVLLTVIIYAIVNFATGRFRVEGDSMQPTMHPNEYVLIDKVSYMLGEPQRGDIVVFHYPFGTERDFIKRVIGLPGEAVTVAGGQVTVNGQALDEPYIAAAPHYQGTWTLGADEYFVMGDNRNNSSDSHSWGPLKREFLIGRALVVYWPLDSLEIVDHYSYASASPQ
jgi:signal peptidase I